MGPIHGANRHAVLLLPERLDDDIAADHPVRFLEAFGDALALAAWGCRRAGPAATGRPGSALGALLQRSLSGALDRRRSHRRLAPAARRTVAWLGRCKPRRPAHQTRAHGRQNPLEPRRPGCRPCTRRGQQRARCGAARVASAGSKCRAGNAPARHCPQAPRTTRRERRLPRRAVPGNAATAGARPWATTGRRPGPRSIHG